MLVHQLVILFTRQRMRALAERASSQENLAGSVGSNEWPAPPPSVSESRRPLFRSFLRSLKAQAQALSVIPTPSEGSEFSWCSGDHSSDSEEDVIYENVHRRSQSAEVVRENESIEHSCFSINSSLDSVDCFSLVASDNVNMQSQVASDSANVQGQVSPSQIDQLCTAMQQTLPIFRGDECEDVHELIRNYKRAG